MLLPKARKAKQHDIGQRDLVASNKLATIRHQVIEPGGFFLGDLFQPIRRVGDGNHTFFEQAQPLAVAKSTGQRFANVQVYAARPHAHFSALFGGITQQSDAISLLVSGIHRLLLSRPVFHRWP